MRSEVRRKLAMGTRVRDFCRAHPDDSPPFATLLGSLEDRLGRADQLAIQQRNGLFERQASVIRRAGIRHTLQQQNLPLLVKVGEEAAGDRPALAGLFRMPKASSPNKVFLTAVTAMYQMATAERDLFVGLGIPGAVLDEIGSLLAEYNQLTESTHAGRRDHVGATAEMERVVKEIAGFVKKLNAMNRIRFRSNAELAAAWRSATDVIGPFRPSKTGPEADTPGGTPPSGGVAPAA